MSDEFDKSSLEFYQSLSQDLRVPYDALVFIFDAMVFAAQYAGEEPGGPNDNVRHCSAVELCHSVRSYATDLWGTDAPAVLTDFGLATSEELGRVVFGLISAGVMQGEPNESEADFSGICRFDWIDETEDCSE